MSVFNSYFLDIIKNKYADFNGRARRSEYWYFVLFNILIAIVINAISFAFVSMGMGGIGTGIGILALIFSVALLIPSLAVAARRLHDTNKSGWFLLLAFVPLANIALLVFFCQDGTVGENKFGPDPKGGTRQSLNSDV